MKILVALLVLVFFVSAFSHQTSKPVWEYKLEYSPSEKRLNSLGSEGWELVAIESKSGSGLAGNVATYVLRRAR